MILMRWRKEGQARSTAEGGGREKWRQRKGQLKSFGKNPQGLVRPRGHDFDTHEW
jgi:hypothetical protein